MGDSLPRHAGLSCSAPKGGAGGWRRVCSAPPVPVALPGARVSREQGVGGVDEIGTRVLNEGEQMSLCCWEAWVACCSDGDRRGADLPGPQSVSVQMVCPPCPLLGAGPAAAGGSGAGGSRLRGWGGGGEGERSGRRPAGPRADGQGRPRAQRSPAAAPRRTMQPWGAGGCAALQLPLHNEACKRAHLILNPLRRSRCEPGRGWPSKPLQSQA